MILPQSLNKGDKVIILSPAGKVEPGYVEGAAQVIMKKGYVPIISKNALGENGTYSGTLEERTQDLINAIADREIKAIFCSRGGYGVVHLIKSLDPQFLIENPKWVIGFSDITALHACLVSAGICSLHAPMCKHISEHGAHEFCVKSVFDILEGRYPEYEVEANPKNRCGNVKGILVGGNMAVMCGLVSSHVDLLRKGSILFIEDIGEEIYKVERMLYMMELSGVLDKIEGLIVGKFTNYKVDDRNGEDMYDMISRMVRKHGFPVVYDFPVGHVARNFPMIEGAEVELSIDTKGTILKFF